MQRQTNILCKHFNDSLLSVFKNSSQVLKQGASKNIYEVLCYNQSQTHNKLMNKILLVSEKDLEQTIRQILSHFLHVAQVKNMTAIVIGLLTKFIQFLKFYQKYLETSKSKKNISSQKQVNTNQIIKKQEQKGSIALKKTLSGRNQIQQNFHYHSNEQIISEILTEVIDIILLIQNKAKSGDSDTFLRIIQTTFSLIDIQFINYMPYSLLTKIYSISFECCLVNAIIQNISVSCLFSLTETLFALQDKEKQAHLLLQNFLEYMFRNKKFMWIKEGQLNGLVWDLVVSGIKNHQEEGLERFVQKQTNVHLINLMYKISAEKAFHSKTLLEKAPPSKQSNKKHANDISTTFKHDPTSQFIRCYKAFIILSIQYSLNYLKSQPIKDQVVPFKENIRLFNVVYDLERNWKMYIMLQGIFLLIQKYPEFAINEQKGYLLLQIVSKIAEQLCLCNHKISCQWAHQKCFLNKIYFGDLSNVNDGDFVKIIRNSLVKMRKKFEYMKNRQTTKGTNSDQSMMSTEIVSSQRSKANSKKSEEASSVRKRWEKFIKCIIKIIRYLSSISILSQTDEQPVRKIILQLQHWFLICPSVKIKNFILQQLLITTSELKSKQHAVKISQCIQIGSNLIYGYYDLLDSIGLTIIMKMMAGIKASKEEGKQFQELQEVFNMSQKLYLQQRIVKTQKQFSTTIQAFVQCANSLLADLEQPPASGKVPALGKNPSQRYYKMIEYLLQKLNIVILQNGEHLFSEWNFLTGFWMSFCSNKNQEIQIKTIIYVGEVIQKLLGIFKDRQEQIISIYLQLAVKCTSKKQLRIEYQIISQIKDFIPLIQNQQALMQTFKIIKVLQTQVIASYELKNGKTKYQASTQQKKLVVQLSELQQAFIKEGIFRIKKLVNLDTIIEGIQVFGNQKNQEYKILTLLWTVADHLRNLSATYSNKDDKQKGDYENLWKKVFEKIQGISQKSPNAETKQSSIHTFTQIIAQNSPVIGDNLLIQLYEKIFIEKLFTELMQNFTRVKNLAQEVDISFKVDMVKTATKNYIKLTKKFIMQKIFKDPLHTVDFALIKVIDYLEQLDNLEPKKVLPIELLYEYLVFVEKLIISQNIETQFINGKRITQIMKGLQKIGQETDHTSILWKKKYLPHFIQVKQKFEKLFPQMSQKSTQVTELKVQVSENEQLSQLKS